MITWTKSLLETEEMCRYVDDETGEEVTQPQSEDDSTESPEEDEELPEDDSDDEDYDGYDETSLESYTTPLDEEDTCVDEYQVFKEVDI